MEEINHIQSKDIVYIDESGIDHNIYKTDCWAKKGEKVIGEKSGSRKERTSVIAALNNKEIKAPFRFQGHTNTEVFLLWIKNVLIPELITGQIVIMDNASFHKSNKIKTLIESVGCRLIFLPPYSPDFNPIENYWAVLKSRIKKIRHKFDNFLDVIDEAICIPYAETTS